MDKQCCVLCSCLYGNWGYWLVRKPRAITEALGSGVCRTRTFPELNWVHGTWGCSTWPGLDFRKILKAAVP